MRAVSYFLALVRILYAFLGDSKITDPNCGLNAFKALSFACFSRQVTYTKQRCKRDNVACTCVCVLRVQKREGPKKTRNPFRNSVCVGLLLPLSFRQGHASLSLPNRHVVIIVLCVFLLKSEEEN